MSKKGKTAKGAQGEAIESENELYYQIDNLTLSGTFNNCQININTGSPYPPPPPPTRPPDK